MKLSAILISQIVFNFIQCQPHALYEHINNRYRYFSSITAYKYVSPVAPYPEPQCKVLQLWVMFRHGTRSPKEHLVNGIMALEKYQNINELSTLEKGDIDDIKSWKYKKTFDEIAGILNNQGIEDMKHSARNLRTLYKDIFNEEYNDQRFRVISSPKERCLDSASAFLNEAFGTNIDRETIQKMELDDNRFNLFKRVNETATEYEKKYIEGPEIKTLIDSVTKTMGLDESLTFETIKSMYNACRYQKSSHINFNSPWCAVFSETDLKILEYYKDLSYYYTNGYGNSNNRKLSKEIIIDLISHFSDKSENKTKAAFYFGHSSNVYSVIVGLVFARDNEHLTDSNFKNMDDRKWRSSYLDPFSSNVRAVLYECNDDIKVTFFINDVPMYVEKYGCTLCSWNSIEEMLYTYFKDQ